MTDKPLTDFEDFRILSAAYAKLVKEVERLRACLHDYENIYPQAKDSLRAENERLRKALREIANYHEDADEEQGHWGNIARAALQSKQGE